ncbi:uncharacterized protein [Asterias amurensis]|uniref:uncharacterized protein n=1 Tax=Asterias amurensis TaxID=7602 RepID=UPI003AB3720C
MARLCLVVLCSLVLVVAGQLEHPCDGSCHEIQDAEACDPADFDDGSKCDCYTCSCRLDKGGLTSFVACCIEAENTAPISIAAGCINIVERDSSGVCNWKTVTKQDPAVTCPPPAQDDGGF